MRKLLQGGWVVDGTGKRKQDVLIDEGKIVQVAENLVDSKAEKVDVTGKLLFPGFIDAHTHFDLEVAGTVTADDFCSGTKAAVVEGTTTILDFATQNHGETLSEALENWNRKSEGKCSCNYGYHMAISDWNEEVSKEMDVMIERGITSFKFYMTYDAMYLEDKELYKALVRMKEINGLAGVHCENRGLIDALIEQEKQKGNMSPKSHPVTRPQEAEAEAINRLLEIAAVVGVPVMIVHLSTKRGYEVVERARARGQEVYVETCPQYLLLNETVYDKPGIEGAKYVIAPPARKEKDCQALWSALKENKIQTIATDHCSFTLGQKSVGLSDFTKIPGGMAGVESRPALVYTHGVKAGRITDGQMCQYLSENASKLYGMYPRKGAILPGSDADIVVWNPECKRTFTAKTQHAKVDYHTYEGMEVFGIAEQVYLGGELVASNSHLKKENRGKFIFRKTLEK